MGVTFQPKAVKNGEIVDSYDRDRREKRTAKTGELSNKMRGQLAKSKKKSNQAINVP